MNQKGYINIMLIVFVVVFAGVVGYLTLIKKPTLLPTTNQTQSTNPLSTQETPQVTKKLETSFTPQLQIPPQTQPTKSQISPTSAYRIMKAEFDSIKTFSDFVRVSRKYASRRVISEVESYESADSESKRIAETFAVSLSKSSPKINDIREIKENINGNTTNLIITVTDPCLTGRITMIFEDGSWKRDKELWDICSQR